ncbi:hypothetical protein CVT25_014650, partial [Psilocybe cyanescens]
AQATLPADSSRLSATFSPATWLNRSVSSLARNSAAHSLSSRFQGCEGPGTALSGTVKPLPYPSLYNNVRSFTCNKAIPK